MNTNDKKLILASGSPRRRELLTLIGFDFTVIPAVVDETPFPDEAPPDYVVRLAALKVFWVREKLVKDVMVIAADTTVVDGEQILGKPNDKLEAEKILLQLRGRIHQVYTGISVAHNETLVSELCGSDVAMRNYSEEELGHYIDSGDPFDKAGAYAIQNSDFHPVENFQGCFANVMGLPLCHLVRALRKCGIQVEKNVPAACQDNLNYLCSIYWKVLREEK